MNQAAIPPAKILVVDDSPGTLYATRRTLTAAGFHVMPTATGQDAITFASQNPVDLVVLDVNLPDMDGFEVCKAIRTYPSLFRVPVVYLSASFVTDIDKVQGFEAGADGYLTHPVEPKVLVATVNAFLRTRFIEAEREAALINERAARAEAEQANRVKDEFLATLSHELRSPLNAIIGWSEVLRTQCPDSPDVMHAVDVIARSARFQAQLISDLLDVSRINSGKLHLEMETVDPATLITESVNVVQHAATARNIGIATAVANDVGAVRGDPARLLQVVTNLIGNAVKFSGDDGLVRVTARRSGAYVEIAVADQGQGIAPSDLPYIFDRFWQEDTSSRRSHSGLGLGLSIVKSLTEMHSGSVAAHSDGPGRGAQFVVRLPREEPVQDGATTQAVADDKVVAVAGDDGPSALSGIRALLVDDDPDGRQWVRRLVADRGADVMDVSNAARAFECIDRWGPHVLISDLAMPLQDGFDLVRRLRTHGIDATKLPAIALSAFGTVADRRKALDAGYQVFMAKPPNPAELLRAVAQLTGRAG